MAVIVFDRAGLEPGEPSPRCRYAKRDFELGACGPL